MDEGLRELDSLLHTGRISFNVSVSGFAEPTVFENFMGAADRVLSWHTGKLACVTHELDSGHSRDVAVLLRHQADSLPDLATLSGEVEAQDGSSARRGFDEAKEGFQEGGFAGSVGAKKAGTAFLDVHREFAYSREVPVFHGQVAD